MAGETAGSTNETRSSPSVDLQTVPDWVYGATRVIVHRLKPLDCSDAQAHDIVIDAIWRHAKPEIKILLDTIEHANLCKDCNGRGKRWYSLIGISTCEKCKGSGKA